ncbi:MAG: phage tail protein I [Sphingobium sp.]|nr:phage tail protein I [Sphingobium sp.]
MTTLSPPNATALDKALEAATARLLDIDTHLRAIWSPTDCPASHLPWLAWALSLDGWDSNWPATLKRERIRRAIAIARRKGTAESVRDVVKSFGGNVAIREWWQMEPRGNPYTFDLLITLSAAAGMPVTASFVDAVINEVRRTKPVRSHFTFTQGLSADAKIGLRAVARPAIYHRLTATVIRATTAALVDDAGAVLVDDMGRMVTTHINVT